MKKNVKQFFCMASTVRINGSRLGGGSKTVLGIALCTIVLAADLVYFGQRVPAQVPNGAPAESPEEAILKRILANSACPTNLDEIMGIATNVFGMAYPELVIQDLRADPVFAEREARALEAMAAGETELLKNPEYVRRKEEALRALAAGPRNFDEASRSVPEFVRRNQEARRAQRLNGQ